MDSDDSNNSDPSGGYLQSCSIRIPNHEIRSLFYQWLRDHLKNSVTRLKKRDVSVKIFRNMVSGSMAKFAKEFAKMIWTSMPSPFLGSKECVYQAFVYSYFDVAGELATQGEWTSVVEGYSGNGRFNFSQRRNHEAAIQEYKRIARSENDKSYGDSQRARLTREAEEGLQQIANRGYRARLPDEVTKLREYGIGVYCAIVGRSLKRAPGGQWRVVESYQAERNERHREKLYNMPVEQA